MKFDFARLFSAVIIVAASQSVHAAAEYEILKSNGIEIILTKSKQPSSSQLSGIGSSRCIAKQFCVIWFFTNREDAKKGVQRTTSGNIWDPVPGLVGIYSKNKKLDQLICYDPSGKEC